MRQISILNFQNGGWLNKTKLVLSKQDKMAISRKTEVKPKRKSMQCNSENVEHMLINSLLEFKVEVDFKTIVFRADKPFSLYGSLYSSCYSHFLSFRRYFLEKDFKKKLCIQCFLVQFPQ